MWSSCVQVASHLISGMSQAVESCVRASNNPYNMQSIGPPSRIAITKAAYAVGYPYLPLQEKHAAEFGSSVCRCRI